MAEQENDAGIPDLKWINRNVPIGDVATKLDLRFGSTGMLHCWHPERHKNGDRTPSVGIRKSTNRLKCFGCDTPPMSAVDLVIDVFQTDIVGAATWFSRNFAVRRIPKGRHLGPRAKDCWFEVGREQPIELLIKSGIWAALSAP